MCYNLGKLFDIILSWHALYISLHSLHYTTHNIQIYWPVFDIINKPKEKDQINIATIITYYLNIWNLNKYYNAINLKKEKGIKVQH